MYIAEDLEAPKIDHLKDLEDSADDTVGKEPEDDPYQDKTLEKSINPLTGSI